MNNRFLTNYSETSFLDYIITALNNCKSFYFSVSFIKKAGLVLLEDAIICALERGVKGKIITSTYQNFTDVSSCYKFFEWMEKYPNFSCHLDDGCFGDNGFHSKGYIFENENDYELIIGSSNITRYALKKNIEWNLSIKAIQKSDSMNDAVNEFDYLWNKTYTLTKSLIEKYSKKLEYAIERWDMDNIDPLSEKIKPNAMQKKALKELQRYRDMNVNKALVVAATGSGKIYLAAFDAFRYGAKRVLFVVHRDKIIHDALTSFKKVFGNKYSYGLYLGKDKEKNCDFVFASNILLVKHLNEFEQDEFDYIVMDECHHAAAYTYKKIMDYFKPGFMLGITATPDRMDNKDIYELFDKNVPYELRLRDAIINNLVVPFHYYGIRDNLVDYSHKETIKIAKEISKADNIKFIKEEIKKHHPSGKLKALAFCASIAHAEDMAYAFNEEGITAVSLSGKDDYNKRSKAFTELQSDDCELEMITCVDILNEGVDIPAVNMVLFLRPTESSIIFLQQLGRGLRKYDGKDYVTVLDFIGNNYKRSVHLAMALGSLGTTTIIEKPYLMELIQTDFNSLQIPGVIINIDKLSKEDIIDYLKKTNFNTKEFLFKDYENFKKYLKRESYPSHMDFLNNDCAPDLMRLIKASLDGKNKSYYSFLLKKGEDSLPFFTEIQKEFIDELSDLLPLVRVDEYLIIKEIIENGSVDLNKLTSYNSKITHETLENAMYHLKKSNILKNDNKLNIDRFTDEFNDYLNDLLEYGLTRYDIEFGEYKGTFKLYANYYKEQVMRVLCKKSLSYMKGTMFENEGVTYLFVGLKKDKEKLERNNYKDKFLSASMFQWESENNTTVSNKIGVKLLNTSIVHLFVRKMDSEDGITLPFTYFGTGHFTNMRDSQVEIFDKKTLSISFAKTLLFDVMLDNSVDEEYYFDFEIPHEEKL